MQELFFVLPFGDDREGMQMMVFISGQKEYNNLIVKILR